MITKKERRTAQLLAAACLLAGTMATAKPKPAPWWDHAVIYEIYPRSFQDSNGDGIGDLAGVTRRLDYLKSLGIDAIWLTPFYPSPNYDFGYDVADYTNVAPEYGTMADFDRLVAEAKKRGIRVLVDFVLNHTSSEHPWFKQSSAGRINAKRDWYVWRDPAPDGGPPTNWKSIFGGSAWTRDAKSGQYYYHVFLPQQPDLNWTNPQVRAAMHDVLRFWLRHGVAGFRLDATPYLLEDPHWPQDPDPDHGEVGLKPYNANLPGNHALLRGLRQVIDAAPGQNVLLGENAIARIEDLDAVYGRHRDEINLPMDFLYSGVRKLDAATFKARIDDAETRLHGAPPVLFFGNHDTSRQATRLGDGVHTQDIARLLAAMTLSLRGTALMYYGEELGMTDLPADALAQVPLGPKRKVADKRDPERTPMQWDATSGAGFTSGAPWLPVNPDNATLNVARQAGDPGSTLTWYRQLLALRHHNPALAGGGYLPLDAGNSALVAFARPGKGGHGVLVVLNFTAATQTAQITGWPAGAPRAQGVLLSSAVQAAVDTTAPTLEPYGVRLIAY